MELRRECLFDALLGGVVVLDAVGDRSEFGELCEAKCSRHGLTVAGHNDFRRVRPRRGGRRGCLASSWESIQTRTSVGRVALGRLGPELGSLGR
jgi:hypothetical protein